ncbi:MAG: hypothetical protein AAFQ67_08850, partial [Pseudomonadota bacterium]
REKSVATSSAGTCRCKFDTGRGPAGSRNWATLFSRHGATLIADKIEDEPSVISVLEYDIPFGQGNVFGAPRPIKASLMAETAPPQQFVESLVGPT